MILLRVSTFSAILCLENLKKKSRSHSDKVVLVSQVLIGSILDFTTKYVHWMESKQIVQKSLLEQENPKDLHFLSSSLVYTVTNKNKPVSKVWLCGCLFSSQACF